MYACLYSAGIASGSVSGGATLSGSPLLVAVAQQFSPRYESRGDLVVIDVRGLDRLFGSPRAIGDELRREAADRGLQVHVAIASTQIAATMLAMSRPGVAVIAPGAESAEIASLPLDVLCRAALSGPRSDRDPERVALQMFKRWGLRTLGDLAALPADELSARLGRDGVRWQAIARGADRGPLVPDVEDERFESSLELEWPIEGLEPLSFVLTRLLEPLSLRLEQRDRGVAVLHVELRLVTAGKEKVTHVRRLELPSPMREVKTLRTLALLDLEAHPPASAIDRVALAVDPTPGRVWQHTLFARPHPTPEQLSTLVARLGAAVGQDRIGVPVVVDSHRPGAFEMKPFAMEHGEKGRTGRMAEHAELPRSPHPACPALPALRRCRQPVPARVAADADGRPAKVTTDRRGFAGGSVLHAVGPWKTSGDWWADGWDRDEWDVALSDGGAYRVFLDRATDRWFIDAILD
jgi:protein ImuB